MRVLHVVTLVDDAASYGGPLTVAVNQCTELRRRGHDARIVAGWRGRGTPPTELEGVPAQLFPVHSLIPGMRFSGLFSLRMARWLHVNAHTFDVAHLHTARDLVPLVAGLQLRRAGVPYSTQTHGMVLPDSRPAARIVDRLMTLSVLRGAETRFVLTEAEEDAVTELLDGGAPVTRLANGIPVPAPRPAEDDLLDVLFLARLHPRKRVLDFARAATTLLAEGVPARFSIVGPDDGDLPALTALIRDADTGGRLHYEGPLPHEAAIARMRRADLFVLPSVDEPFPMTLLEALANGVPSICTTSCGLADVLRQERAAMVIKPGERSLTTALRLLVADPRLRSDLAARAVQTAQQRYSVANVADVLLETYAGADGSTRSAATSLDLLWLTNIPAPYTVPVWRELARITDVHIACMAQTEFNRDWKVDVSGVPLTILGARAVKAGAERTLYLPTWRMLRLFRRHRPRVVVLDGWESPAFWQARILARLTGSRVVLSYWSTAKTHRFSTGPVAAFRGWFFRTADGVITPGQDATDAVLAMGVPATRITTAFGTVDVDRFAESAGRIRNSLPRDDGHRYLFVGQLIQRKNVGSLLEAFAEVRGEDDKLSIVGNGPLNDELREKAVTLDISDSVIFRGHLEGEDLLYAYAGADTLVLPSTEEVWGLVANEALASGLKVVISENCGVTNSIRDLPDVLVASSPDELRSSLRQVSQEEPGSEGRPGTMTQTPASLARFLIDSIR